MFIYTNSFRGATNGSRSEFTLEFMQNTPLFGEGENAATVIGTKDEIVSSIVMTVDGVVALRNMLNRAIEDFSLDPSHTEIVD